MPRRFAETLSIREFRELTPEYAFTAPLYLGEPKREGRHLDDASGLPSKGGYSAVVVIGIRRLGSTDEPKLISIIYVDRHTDAPSTRIRSQFLKCQNEAKGDSQASGSTRAHLYITANGHRAEYFALVARVAGTGLAAREKISRRMDFLAASPWRLEALDAFFPHPAAAAAPAPAAAAAAAAAAPAPAAAPANAELTAALAAMTAERDALAATVARLEGEKARRRELRASLATKRGELAAIPAAIATMPVLADMLRGNAARLEAEIAAMASELETLD
jgi:hypothetical protein